MHLILLNKMLFDILISDGPRGPYNYRILEMEKKH